MMISKHTHKHTKQGKHRHQSWIGIRTFKTIFDIVAFLVYAWANSSGPPRLKGFLLPVSMPICFYRYFTVLRHANTEQWYVSLSSSLECDKCCFDVYYESLRCSGGLLSELRTAWHRVERFNSKSSNLILLLCLHRLKVQQPDNQTRTTT